jgi:hypothetical protein
MHAPVKNPGRRDRAAHEPASDLTNWLMDAALLMFVVSCVALAVAYVALTLTL